MVGSTFGDDMAYRRIFHIAGIYGPGRSALDTVRDGRARQITKAGQVFSRIHVDDIAAILAPQWNSPGNKAYNSVMTKQRRRKTSSYAYSLLEVDAPPEIPFENAELSDMASFYQDNKRVSNARIQTTSAFTSHGQPIGRDCGVF